MSAYGYEKGFIVEHDNTLKKTLIVRIAFIMKRKIDLASKRDDICQKMVIIRGLSVMALY